MLMFYYCFCNILARWFCSFDEMGDPGHQLLGFPMFGRWGFVKV